MCSVTTGVADVVATGSRSVAIAPEASGDEPDTEHGCDGCSTGGDAYPVRASSMGEYGTRIEGAESVDVRRIYVERARASDRVCSFTRRVAVGYPLDAGRPALTDQPHVGNGHDARPLPPPGDVFSIRCHERNAFTSVSCTRSSANPRSPVRATAKEQGHRVRSHELLERHPGSPLQRWPSTTTRTESAECCFRSPDVLGIALTDRYVNSTTRLGSGRRWGSAFDLGDFGRSRAP